MKSNFSSICSLFCSFFLLLPLIIPSAPVKLPIRWVSVRCSTISSFSLIPFVFAHTTARTPSYWGSFIPHWWDIRFSITFILFSVFPLFSINKSKCQFVSLFGNLFALLVQVHAQAASMFIAGSLLLDCNIHRRMYFFATFFLPLSLPYSSMSLLLFFWFVFFSILFHSASRIKWMEYPSKLIQNGRFPPFSSLFVLYSSESFPLLFSIDSHKPSSLLSILFIIMLLLHCDDQEYLLPSQPSTTIRHSYTQFLFMDWDGFHSLLSIGCLQRRIHKSVSFSNDRRFNRKRDEKLPSWTLPNFQSYTSLQATDWSDRGNLLQLDFFERDS